MYREVGCEGLKSCEEQRMHTVINILPLTDETYNFRRAYVHCRFAEPEKRLLCNICLSKNVHFEKRTFCSLSGSNRRTFYCKFNFIFNCEMNKTTFSPMVKFCEATRPCTVCIAKFIICSSTSTAL